jgi:hypothetical protein
LGSREALDRHASELIYLQSFRYIFNQGYLVTLAITNLDSWCRTRISRLFLLCLKLARISGRRCVISPAWTGSVANEVYSCLTREHYDAALQAFSHHRAVHRQCSTVSFSGLCKFVDERWNLNLTRSHGWPQSSPAMAVRTTEFRTSRIASITRSHRQGQARIILKASGQSHHRRFFTPPLPRAGANATRPLSSSFHTSVILISIFLSLMALLASLSTLLP